FELSSEKVAVIPWGSVMDAYPEPSAADLAATRESLALPADFLVYPGQTWPHKNHLGLLAALGLIRGRYGTVPPVVCPGHPNADFQPLVDERARELGVQDEVIFPGFVSPLQLRSLYRLARGMVFPSRFEGWGMPVIEAFSVGLPVTCSSVA